jgi:hypothetical protein
MRSNRSQEVDTTWTGFMEEGGLATGIGYSKWGFNINT